MNDCFERKKTRAYIFLATLVICGLAGSLVTASKIVHFIIDFPFSNIVFSILTYPIVDCICELFGKKAARQAMWLGLGSQIFIAFIIQLSILFPHSPLMEFDSEYQ